MTKLYKISAPLGSNIVPKEKMTEAELRDFFPQIVQEPSDAEIWIEKAEKDEVEELVELLQRADYSVEVIEE